tara:strand:+ start:360 stop:776 length:417 start_codon:yes stop_codon:yes gene_type:complete
LPKIGANLEMRKSQILENISAAEKKREESELKIKEFEEIVEKSKNEAKSYLNQAKEKLTKNINIKKEVLEKELSEEINKVEEEIQELRKKAPERINKIAAETSTDLLHQLIGAEVNNSSISAIVDDLSRKKMAKYYGN